MRKNDAIKKVASLFFAAAITISTTLTFSVYADDSLAQKNEEQKEADIRQRTLLKQALDQVVDAGTPKEDIACYEIPHSDRNVTCVVILGNNGISKLFLSDSEGVKANIDSPDANSFVYGYSENEEILVKESAENGYRYVVYKFNGKELEELSVLNVNGEDITYDGKALTPDEAEKAAEELKAGFNEFSELEKLPYDSAIFKFYRPVSDTWQQRYIELMDAYLDNFLAGNSSKNDTSFELCDINSDGKPELYVHAPESATMLAFPRETAPLALLNSSFGNDQMIVRYTKGGNKNYLTYNSDGTVSLQILESSQIDKNNKQYMDMFAQGTHFNPVDLVCATKDYKGNDFDLPKYVDPKTGFISNKSKNGKELKALELPGLWNGAMSDWNTVFVEVPLSTFNPVKTVNDLLRDQHQAKA